VAEKHDFLENSMQRQLRGAAARPVFATASVLLALIGLVSWSVRAADKPGNKSVDIPEPVDKVLQTKDGGSLHVTYYKSPGDRESPVVVLLHMKDGNRFVWQGKEGFAPRLQKEGYAVITVDLRYHGQSKAGGTVGAGNANQGAGKKKKKAGIDLKNNDLDAMVACDMEAVKDFIKDEHQAGNLNMNKMGIVGPEMGASIAVAYAALDWDKEPYDDAQPGFQTPRGQDVRALVLISPQEKYHGMAMAKLITPLKDPDLGIALLICSSSEAQDKKESEKIFEMATTPSVNKKRMYLKTYGGKLTGTELLGKGLQIEDYMLVFFKKHLIDLDAPWRDRASKRDKLNKKK
jgi:pimeloyl-ACP methyl ester carboxylesterase